MSLVLDEWPVMFLVIGARKKPSVYGSPESVDMSAYSQREGCAVLC